MSLLLAIFVISSPVKEVKLQGFKHLPRNEILRILNIKPGEEFIYPLLKGGLTKLKELYRQKGYFHFQILEEKVTESEDGVRIQIKVDEGPRAVVVSYEYPDTVSIPEKMIRRIFGRYKTPRFYDESEFYEIENSLIRVYSEQGYTFAEISYVTEEIAQDTFRVVFDIKEGPQVVIKGVKFVGLKSVRRKIVEREVKFDVPSIYRESKVLQTIRGIYLTGLFSTVRRELKTLTPTGDTIEIIFHLTEVKPRYLDLGMGYRLPSDFQIKFTVGHLNLFNNNQKIEFSSDLLIRPGKSIDRGFVRRRAEITYSEPYLLGFPLRGVLRPFYEKDLIVKKEEYGLAMEIQKIFTPYFSITWGLEWKRSPIRTGISGPISNSFIMLPLYDSRDNIFDPKKGAFISLRLQQAGWILDGDNYFRRIFFDYSQYATLTPHFVLAGRIRFGSQEPFGPSEHIPSTDRFYLGGEGSVRGFDEQSIGPIDPENPQIHSGDQLINFNFELRYRNGNWGGAAFVDGGTLTEKFNELRDAKFFTSVGLGLRYYTIIGPIRADWGYKLQDRHPGYKGKFYLAIGHMF